MSTTYYFEVKIEKVLEDDALCKLALCEFVNPLYISNIKHDLEYIHIGQRSTGRKPLLHKTRFYNSMKTLKEFYTKHQDELIIKDEYKRILSWEELTEKLFDWNKDYRTNFSCLYDECYVDDDGYEWTEREFS